MRFVPDGPSIPDHLLLSRDEGQVVFFCGAGVSRAKAKLHDFAGLANAVADNLGSAQSSAARQLLAAAMSQQRIRGVGSLLATDRVFSLLESEFEIADVRAAVAEALRYPDGVDRSAHELLLDLARGPDGEVRLVTTNFDHLFEGGGDNPVIYIPPSLPRPNRPQEWGGVIYLHGRLGPNFVAPPPNEEFVLSSADFGRAYLSDGWATGFIRGLIEQFQIVFVGYAADDPPLQYLLEALNGSAAGRLYAFQAGPADQARALWASKGVQAIPYREDATHSALWTTLDAWAERARDQEAWHDRLLEKAKQGPKALAPHERGQVKHVVSTPAGALRFLRARPPAEWLCVFDPAVRFGSPERSDDRAVIWDPFDDYQLDDDPLPASDDPENPYKRREVPKEAWDAFGTLDVDRTGSSSVTLSALTGPRSVQQPSLPPRLGYLASWIAQVSADPIAPWWAAGAGGLHHDLVSSIRRGFKAETHDEATLRAWELIFASLDYVPANNDYRWYDFASEIALTGWSPQKVMQWGRLLSPRVTVSRDRRVIAPPAISPTEEAVGMRPLVSGDVQYPKEHDRLKMPDEFLPLAAEQVRQGLTDALALEAFARGYLYISLPPIRPDARLKGDGYTRDYGMARLFFRYVRVLQDLVRISPAEAMREASRWPRNEVFDRLRVWAAGEWDCWPTDMFESDLAAFGDEIIWGMYAQRDLLLTLKAKWTTLSKAAREGLVGVILVGPDAMEGESPDDYTHRRAFRALERLEWLRGEGCDLGALYEGKRDQLLTDVRVWKEKYATDAAASPEGTSGYVGSDEDASILTGASLSDVLALAASHAGHDWERGVEKRPFKGVVTNRPRWAFKALTKNAMLGEVPQWAWDDFFYDEGRKQDGERFRSVIARRLSRLPQDAIRARIRPISRWMADVAKDMPADGTPWFATLWEAVVEAIAADPACGRSSISGSRRDWVMLALNSPGGDLTQALLSMAHPQDDAGFNPIWIGRVGQLLGIGGEVRRATSVLLLRNLPWFHYWAPDWTAQNLLTLVDGDADDEEAFWAGVLSATRPPPAPLFDRLKSGMMGLALQADDHDKTERLAAFLLSGWAGRRGNKQRYVSDQEMRELLIEAGDQFRGQVLWTLERWSGETPTWKARLRYFLANVWPRQRVAKSPQISSRLFDLAVEAGRSFSIMVDLVEPLMTEVDGSTHVLFKVTREKSLIERQPAAVLKLLFKALPADASKWPWGAEEAVNRLSRQKAVSVDSRMIQLRRRLAAR